MKNIFNLKGEIKEAYRRNGGVMVRKITIGDVLSILIPLLFVIYLCYLISISGIEEEVKIEDTFIEENEREYSGGEYTITSLEHKVVFKYKDDTYTFVVPEDDYPKYNKGGLAKYSVKFYSGKKLEPIK